MWNTKTNVLCGNPSWRNISYHACGDYFLNFGMNCSPRSTDDPCWQKRRLETNDKLEMSAVTEPDWRLTVQVEKVLKAVLVNTNLASGICIMHPQFFPTLNSIPKVVTTFCKKILIVLLSDIKNLTWCPKELSLTKRLTVLDHQQHPQLNFSERSACASQLAPAVRTRQYFSGQHSTPPGAECRNVYVRFPIIIISFAIDLWVAWGFMSPRQLPQPQASSPQRPTPRSHFNDWFCITLLSKSKRCSIKRASKD